MTRSIIFVLAITTIAAAVAQSPPALREVPASEAQKYLDILARPGPGLMFNIGLPAVYADWTDTQRKEGLTKVSARCAMIAAMMNGTGPVQLLAPAQDRADNLRIPIVICTAAHMPADWPARAATLASIQRILARSTELGKPLALPGPLAK